MVIFIQQASLPIKAHRPPLLLHVHLELARRPTPLPPEIPVAQPIPALTQDKAEAPARRITNIQNRRQRPAQLRKGIDALLAKSLRNRNQPVDNRQVLGLDANDEHELKLDLAVQHAN